MARELGVGNRESGIGNRKSEGWSVRAGTTQRDELEFG
ncbi:hypothetical protein GGR70_000140 [Xanthomonas campestris]|nr:hypothetical protein [Xanthomonas campestris]